MYSIPEYDKNKSFNVNDIIYCRYIFIFSWFSIILADLPYNGLIMSNSPSLLGKSISCLYCLESRRNQQFTKTIWYLYTCMLRFRDGTMKTGLYCAVSNIIDCIDWYNEADVFHIVRDVQTRRPETFLSEVNM